MLRDDFGVGRGDRVAVYSQNRVEFIEVQFACARLGAVFVPLNWRLTIHELDYIVSDASPTVLVADPELGDMAAELVERTNTPHLIVFSGDGAHPDRSANYDDGLAAVDTTTLPVMPELTHDDPLTIMYTSGTTGRPKGAVITHGMSFWNSVNLAELHDLSRSMVNFCFLPLFHTGGLNCYTNPAAYFGGSTMVMRTFDPGRALELISDPERRITHFLGVPANYLFMGQHPDFASTDFSRLVSTAIGGAPAALPLLKMWESVGCPLIQAFGMTETSPLVLSISKEMAVEKAGSAGLPAMNTAIRIVGEDGVDVGVGEIGELWCKGPNITPGYWNNPEATAEVLSADGWYHTSDAGFLDSDGHLKIIDRVKDVGRIKGGAFDGSMFAPKYVENKLKFFSFIKEAVAYGDQRERVCVMVNIDFDAVGNWAERQNLPYAGYADLSQKSTVYDMIRDCVEQVNADLSRDAMLAGSQVSRFLILHKELDPDDGELTRTNKVRRGFIAEKYGVLVEALYGDKTEQFIETQVKFEDGRTGAISATLQLRDAKIFTPVQAAA